MASRAKRHQRALNMYNLLSDITASAMAQVSSPGESIKSKQGDAWRQAPCFVDVSMPDDHLSEAAAPAPAAIYHIMMLLATSPIMK